MSIAGRDPVPNAPAVAIAALEAHLPQVLRGQSPEEAGWVRLDKLTLLIPLHGERQDGTCDSYLLRLHFGYYPEWPPSALFVNPETKTYVFPADSRWLPQITGTNEIAIHTNYGDIGQLVCCSATLEFYRIRHSVEPKHIWDGARQNFAATLNAIRRGLKPPFYQGRQG